MENYLKKTLLFKTVPRAWLACPHLLKAFRYCGQARAFSRAGAFFTNFAQLGELS
jgi:hypothetical protein